MKKNNANNAIICIETFKVEKNARKMNVEEGIAHHVIPFYNDSREEAVKRRKKWIDFVVQRRAKWNPSKWSVICSNHFTADDYMYRYGNLAKTEDLENRWLKRDELGINVFPTIFAVEKEEQPTDREKRMVRYTCCCWCRRGVIILN